MWIIDGQTTHSKAILLREFFNLSKTQTGTAGKSENISASLGEIYSLLKVAMVTSRQELFVGAGLVEDFR